MGIGLDLLGGVGKGVMVGADQIRRQEEHDASLALRQQQAAEASQLRQAQAARLDEDQTWQRQDRARAEEERQRGASYQQLFQQTAAELGEDATPEQLGAEVLKRGLRAGVIPQKEVAPLLQQAAKLRQLGVTNAFRRGDVGELGRIMSGPQQYGRPVRMELSKGTDEFGQPTDRYRVVDEADGKTLADFSPLQLGSILGADDLLEEYEQKQKIRKTNSEIGENQAQARAADALARERDRAPAGGHGSAVDPTRGFSATAREEARRVELERKVTNGTATPEERDLLGVLQAQAKQRGAGYVPPEAKKARYWRDAPPAEAEAEVERQLAAIRMQASSDPYLQQQLKDPATLDILRRDIRQKLGRTPSGSAEQPRGAADGMTGQRPMTATTGNGTATAAPRDLNQFLR